ncbi:FkbM family methyltransferase [Rivihabitans pingtungensis]|uniref:FkbM family methyltransferase n=2 Tax=Rivihabitans pingtungensis TaxID=1054498 RepID=UPI00235574E1|nr:FkbM family methyltransferase [Rivihabitans pingtungensis]MCK6436563.1 FkbM family methyltransferase [Rivihabitans pingtungensis]
MSFISYAQNGEDVMLMRALKHVEHGFYIDVGANHPSDDSVTKAFYDLGWHGLNIEPLDEHIAQLRAERLRDINLQLAVGASVGEITLYNTEVRGLATASAEVAERHASQGLATHASVVPMRPLSDICAEYAAGREIHFLKIDVEGFETDVLKGMDFQRFRPWVVLVEATLPNSQQINADWEPMIVGAGYRWVYFDGLNRYYVADEHAGLADAFRAPPNVFDGHVPAEQHRLAQELAAAHKATEREWLRANKAQALAEQTRATLQAELDGVYTSKSWQLTRPLRAVMGLLRQLRDEAPRHKQQARAKLMAWLSRPSGAVLAVLERHPALKQALIAVAKRLGVHSFLQALKWKALTRRELQLYTATGELRPHPRVLPAFPTLPETLLLAEPAQTAARWVRLTGHVEGHYSLAIVNRGLAGALERINQQRLSFVPYHGQPYAEAPNLPAEQDAPLHAALRRAVPDDAAGQAISVVHHYPFITDAQPAGQRGIVFFWEETSVPADTIAHLNAHFDVVWVAAESVKRALLNSGCRPPVFVIPIGVDHLIPAEAEPLGALRVADGQRLRFLHVSSVFERKGADVLLAAYLDAFSADDAVELYIKTFPNPHNQIHQQLEALSAGRDKPARVIIDEAPLDDAGMLALYRSAHAMVLPTRGEGFNLPAAEALAMALPVVTTGHSAQADFCSHATATLVNFHFAASRSHVRASDACWLEPDRADLAAKLQLLRQRILADDPALQAQRDAGLRHVRDTYRWDNGARGLLASADWLARQPKAEPGPLRLALLSPWATRCGIAEYSHKLLRAMVDAPEVALTVYCDDRTDSPPAHALSSWTLGNNDSVPGVLERIGQSDAQVVLVQHQPSLFPLSDACCIQLAALSQQGRVVMLELHSTLPLLVECRVSAAAVSALAQIDRIIVHKPEDLNHLLALGLADNVMLLHHGVVQPLAEPQPDAVRAELGIPADALVLGCFGFALAHKGIDTLVETVKPLARASGRAVHLLALNSILDERSERMIQQYQQRARQLGVDGQIHWITDYRPIETCQRLLGAADYIVFPYKHTRESASGAVTIGLSTLKPVLVSPLEIFSDLPDVTWKMDGHEAEDIVRAVQALSAQPDAAAALIARQRDWLSARDWDSLSARLLTVMGALRRECRLADAIAPARRAWQAGWTAQRRKQLLVDVSELYHRDARTGIQRVVRSILNELFLQPPAGYDICPVYGDKTEGFRYTGKFHPEGVGEPREGQPVQAGPGDVFLGLDLAAHLFPEAEQQLAAFRLAGARVYYVVYDIIPLRHAQFTVAGITQAFDVWLRSLARCADGLMCISDAVAQDVAAWLREQAPGAPLPMIGHFHLGADLDSSTPTRGLPADAEATLARMDGGVSFLMVGTIEPRKGHAQTLAAFEQLWADGDDSRLVLVGKQGWKMDEFAQQLRQHPQAGKNLLWLEGASDEYLEKIYARADCLIAASECEGFGLPLIEAAQHKLPVLARDIAVFREVAGEHAAYFCARQPQELAQALRDWLRLFAADAHPRSDSMPWLSWRDSARALLRPIID